MIATIAIFLAVLVILVCIHEAGHFFAAKKSGVRVDEFGFGFPPRLFGKKWRGTMYTINLLPLGGFVKINGLIQEDDGENAEKKDPSSDSFAHKSFPKKIAILSAGIVMNAVLAVVLFAITFMIGIDSSREGARESARISNERIAIVAIQENSPAQQAGLQAGDHIVRIENEIVTNAAGFSDRIQKAEGKNIALTITRDDAEQTIQVTPTRIDSQGEQLVGIGVGLADIAFVQYPFFQALWQGVTSTVNLSVQIIAFLFQTIVQIISPTESVDTDQVSGPVGLAVVIKNAADSGISSLLYMSAVLSVNLAIFNLLPIPMLDGGRIAFTIIERIRKKPLPKKVEIAIYNIGFFLLLGMVILVTVRDIIKL